MLRNKLCYLRHELIKRRRYSTDNDNTIKKLLNVKNKNIRSIRISINKNDYGSNNDNNKNLLYNSRKWISSSSASSTSPLDKEEENDNINNNTIDKEMEGINIDEWKDLLRADNDNDTTNNDNLSSWKHQIKKIKYQQQSIIQEQTHQEEEQHESSSNKKIIRKHDFMELLHLYDEIKQEEANAILSIQKDKHKSQKSTTGGDEEDDDALLSQQIWNECEAQREWIDEYQSLYSSAIKRKSYSSIPPVKQCLLSWYTPLRNAIEVEQKLYYTNAKGGKDRFRYGAYLCLVQPEKLAVITTHECTNHALECGGTGATLAAMSIRIGGVIEAEVNVQRLLFRKFVLDKKTATEGDDKKNPTATATESDDNKPENVKNNNIEDEDKSAKWSYTPTHLQTFLDEIDQQKTQKLRLRILKANKRAQQLLSDEEPWSTSTKAKLGSALIHLLLNSAYLPNTDPPTPAFKHEKRWISYNKLVGHIVVHDDFYNMTIMEKYRTLAPYTTRFQPMVIPPLPWTKKGINHKYLHGAYYVLNSEFMRTRGCTIQQKALPQADLSIVTQGLNYLSSIPWRIHPEMKSIAHQCWDNNIVLGDIPSQHDHIVPDKPPMPAIIPATTKQEQELQIEQDQQEQEEQSDDSSSTEDKKSQHQKDYMKYREQMLKHKRSYQRNLDLRSLRCSLFLKLSQADKFAPHSKIYFPFNLDFRGRAYPIPPHLSTVGSDLCRSLLTFEKKKPLGERGLFWLFVHLANLVGQDKISFEERYQYTQDHLEDIYASVKQPISSDINDKSSWWRREPDDPFQALATCHEIVNALECGHDPTLYESNLPVHMDGSCNGLQHYAALGRDAQGGFAVNLRNNVTSPQDVYSGVMEKVIQRVEQHTKLMDDSELYQLEKEKIIASGNNYNDATIEKEILKKHKAAKLVHGLIDRGVVKRTVMTSVYGVTPIGARKQIKEKIEEKLKEKGVDVDDIEKEIHVASGYLASVTMEAIGQLFTGARETMNWLTTCARLITTQEHPVAWVSPIGVPIVQPYRQSKAFTVITLVQRLVLTSNSDDLPIHKQRQVSAFPPNYVHSLDSSHMILTANEMQKRGLTFSAVHDSFWTHACDIDEMNGVLRQTFVDLYEKPLLEELKSNWEMRYPGITFPDIPEKGNLDLNEVLDAPYFFQ